MNEAEDLDERIDNWYEAYQEGDLNTEYLADEAIDAAEDFGLLPEPLPGMVEDAMSGDIDAVFEEVEPLIPGEVMGVELPDAGEAFDSAMDMDWEWFYEEGTDMLPQDGEYWSLGPINVSYNDFAAKLYATAGSLLVAAAVLN